MNKLHSKCRTKGRRRNTRDFGCCSDQWSEFNNWRFRVCSSGSKNRLNHVLRTRWRVAQGVIRQRSRNLRNSDRRHLSPWRQKMSRSCNHYRQSWRPDYCVTKFFFCYQICVTEFFNRTLTVILILTPTLTYQNSIVVTNKFGFANFFGNKKTNLGNNLIIT